MAKILAKVWLCFIAIILVLTGVIMIIESFISYPAGTIIASIGIFAFLLTCWSITKLS